MTEASTAGKTWRIRRTGQQDNGKHVGNDDAPIEVAIVEERAKLAEIAVLVIRSVDLIHMN